MVTKEELLEENEKLKAQLSKLNVPTEPGKAKKGHQFIYIPSVGLDYVPEFEGKKETRYMKGSINGKSFKVECDKYVEVEEAVADVMAGAIKNQKAK